MDYWKECIEEALCDAQLTATKEQTDTIISWVEGAFENYGLATGQECIPNPLEGDVRELKGIVNTKHPEEIRRIEDGHKKECENLRWVINDLRYKLQEATQ